MSEAITSSVRASIPHARRLTQIKCSKAPPLGGAGSYATATRTVSARQVAIDPASAPLAASVIIASSRGRHSENFGNAA